MRWFLFSIGLMMASSAMADGMPSADACEDGQAVAKQVKKPVKKTQKLKKTTPQRKCSVDPNDCACQLLGERTKLSGKAGQVALTEFFEVSCAPVFLPKQVKTKYKIK